MKLKKYHLYFAGIMWGFYMRLNYLSIFFVICSVILSSSVRGNPSHEDNITEQITKKMDK